MKDDEGKPQEGTSPDPSEDPLSAAIVIKGPDSEAELDLSLLSEEARSELVRDYAKGMIDVNTRAQNLKLDVGALRSVLDHFVQTTQEVTETEGAYTNITFSQATEVGQTQIIMGNTEQSRKGRLTRSQTGERDLGPMLVIGGLIVIVIVVIAVLASVF